MLLYVILLVVLAGFTAANFCAIWRLKSRIIALEGIIRQATRPDDKKIIP